MAGPGAGRGKAWSKRFITGLFSGLIILIQEAGKSGDRYALILRIRTERLFNI
jgi:hypothetical protein